MIFFEKVSDRLTKRRDTDLPSMRQMKAETEKPLSPEFQANRSMFRYFPESRQKFALQNDSAHFSTNQSRGLLSLVQKWAESNWSARWLRVASKPRSKNPREIALQKSPLTFHWLTPIYWPLIGPKMSVVKLKCKSIESWSLRKHRDLKKFD